MIHHFIWHTFLHLYFYYTFQYAAVYRTVDGAIAWQTDAQKVMGCTNQQRKIYTTSTGREYCLSDWETVLIYSERTSNLTIAEKAEMEAKRIALINNYLSSIFGAGHCKAKNTGYPVSENTTDYLECIK